MTAPVHRRPVQGRQAQGRPVVQAGPHLAARAERERQERRVRRLRRAGYASLAALPLAALAWVLLASPLLALRTVRVEGVGRLTPVQVELAAAVAPGRPLARIDLEAVAERVARLSPVADVDVTRRWPSTLVLRVTERVPVAVTAGGNGQWRLVDAGGAVFGILPGPPDDLPRLALAPAPGGDGGDPATRSALDVLRALPTGLRAQVAEVQAPSPAAVTLLLRDGRSVVWGAAEQAERKAAVVEALLRRPGRTVDVTAPAVAVVR